MDKKKLNVGDEVLVFDNSRTIRRDIEPFVRGKVFESYQSDDIAYHGTPWYVDLYKVRGEDGRTYSGSYRYGELGTSYFLTPEDYILYLYNKINSNHQKIKELNDLNDKLLDEINSVKYQENVKKLTLER